MSRAGAYVYDTRDGSHYPGPTIPVIVRLGASSTPLSDGSATFNSTVERAMMLWNQQIANAQFSWTEAPRTQAPSADGVTSISFEDSIYGQSLGGNTLALTMIRNSGGRMIETDIAISRSRQWDSFFGPLSGHVPDEIHRVALHELGHALGLDHPDQKGQAVPAIMNSRVSDLDQLQQDDVNGARSLYGTPPNPPPLNANGRLANISTRVNVGPNDRVLIGGFIIRDAAKQVLIRALGPSLPLPATLQDPALTLFDSNGAVLATNDDWRATQQEAIAATTIPPANDAEAAIVATLPPGAYTATVFGSGSTSGLALVEVYDLSPGSGRLANISTRGYVATGDNVMIAGFIIAGAEPKTVVVRAIGPSLRSSIPDALVDTALELRNSNGDLLTAVAGCPQCAEGGGDVYGLSPGDPAESIITQRLAPGNFTVILRSPSAASGIGLIEVYDVSP